MMPHPLEEEVTTPRSHVGVGAGDQTVFDVAFCVKMRHFILEREGHTLLPVLTKFEFLPQIPHLK